jgi:hypothetical protein
MIAGYLATLNGHTEREIADGLKEASTVFRALNQRWQRLEQMGRALGELTLFADVPAKLGKPLHIPPRSALADQSRPVALPVIPEGKLNFAYGAPRLADNAARGLRQHGPYDEHQPRRDVLRAAILAPQAFKVEARRWGHILEQGIETFEGLKQRYRLRSFEADVVLFDDCSPSGYAVDC